MSIYRIALLGFTLALWSCAGDAQVDPSDLKEMVKEKIERVEVERVDDQPISQCKSDVVSGLTGTWTVYRGAGSFGYGDEISIDGSMQGPFRVNDSSDIAMKSGEFIAVCNGDMVSIQGSYEDHGCVHSIRITLISNSDPMNYDQNCEGFFDPDMREDCRLRTNEQFQKHIRLSTFHSGERCPIPDYWSHPGVAHAGGTGEE